MSGAHQPREGAIMAACGRAPCRRARRRAGGDRRSSSR